MSSSDWNEWCPTSGHQALKFFDRSQVWFEVNWFRSWNKVRGTRLSPCRDNKLYCSLNLQIQKLLIQIRNIRNWSYQFLISIEQKTNFPFQRSKSIGLQFLAAQAEDVWSFLGKISLIKRTLTVIQAIHAKSIGSKPIGQTISPIDFIVNFFEEHRNRSWVCHVLRKQETSIQDPIFQ